MGQKVHPKIFRIGITTDWNAKWFARGKKYASLLKQDILIRKFLKNRLKEAGVAKVEIERSPDQISVIIYTSKPGLIIGRGGAGIEEIRKEIQKKTLKDEKFNLKLEIKEVEKPQLFAQIVAQNIALELEKRIPYRRTMKRAIDQVMKAGALGIKVICSGRLGGVEIARRETLSQGKIPLNTLRADIDYGRTAAFTTYGAVGVKVWIYKGEIF